MKVEYGYEYIKKVVDFSCLEPGDAFIFNAGRSACIDDYLIFIKCQESSMQLAINLRTGSLQTNCCKRLVIPVIAVVKWKYESA